MNNIIHRLLAYMLYVVVLFASCVPFVSGCAPTNANLEFDPPLEQNTLHNQETPEKMDASTKSIVHNMPTEETKGKDIYAPQPLITDYEESASQRHLAHMEANNNPAGMASTDLALPKDTGEPFIINMENAELYDVILFFTDLLKLNCIIEPNLSGKITIQTSTPLHREDLLPLFYQILEANGLTAIKEGKYYRIVNIANASRASLPISQQGFPLSQSSEMVMQIAPLTYINNKEMVDILTPFLSENGSIISNENSKTLLIVDTKKNVLKLLKLIRSFDIDILDSIKYQFFWVKNVASTKIEQTVSSLLSVYDKEGTKTQVINLEKLNALLVFADNESLFKKISDFIKKIDIPSMDAEPHIYLYFLKNSRAADMANLLNNIFSRVTEKKVEVTKTELNEIKNTNSNEQNPFAAKTKPKSGQKTTRRTSMAVDDYGTGSLRSEMRITQDEIRNVLIIKAIPSDYRIIEKVLKRLDILPRQVLISVTIADVQLDDDLELGVEWSYLNRNVDSGDQPSFFNLATGSEGLLYSIGQLGKWKATLSALAQKKKVDIVATPSILASDNIKASIDISTEIPVASAQIQYDNNNVDKTQTDIQYRNTGIILNVTPHINEYGLVTMELNQEVSEQSTPVDVGDASYPSFFKRSVSTTLTVNSNQTIAIGGLIRKVQSNSNSGVPFLSNIPILGWLFGTQGKSVSKSELILLLTPTVIATPDEIDAVTEEFTRKTSYNKMNNTRNKTNDFFYKDIE